MSQQKCNISLDPCIFAKTSCNNSLGVGRKLHFCRDISIFDGGARCLRRTIKKSFGVHKWDHHGCHPRLPDETQKLIRKYYARDFEMRKVLCPTAKLEKKRQERTPPLEGYEGKHLGQGLESTAALQYVIKLGAAGLISEQNEAKLAERLASGAGTMASALSFLTSPKLLLGVRSLLVR